MSALVWDIIGRGIWCFKVWTETIVRFGPWWGSMFLFEPQFQSLFVIIWWSPEIVIEHRDRMFLFNGKDECITRSNWWRNQFEKLWNGNSKETLSHYLLSFLSRMKQSSHKMHIPFPPIKILLITDTKTLTAMGPTVVPLLIV